MSLWTDLIAPMVGTLLGVSTIFFPLAVLLGEVNWTQPELSKASYQVP